MPCVCVVEFFVDVPVKMVGYAHLDGCLHKIKVIEGFQGQKMGHERTDIIYLQGKHSVPP